MYYLRCSLKPSEDYLKWWNIINVNAVTEWWLKCLFSSDHSVFVLWKRSQWLREILTLQRLLEVFKDVVFFIAAGNVSFLLLFNNTLLTLQIILLFLTVPHTDSDLHWNRTPRHPSAHLSHSHWNTFKYLFVAQLNSSVSAKSNLSRLSLLKTKHWEAFYELWAEWAARGENMDFKKASLYSTQLGFLPVLLPFSVSMRGICHGGCQTPRGCLDLMNRAKGLCPHTLLSISFSVDVQHQRQGNTLRRALHLWKGSHTKSETESTWKI